MFTDHVPRNVTGLTYGAARRKPCGALELQVSADRDRIARDLHEHVIGRLFGIGLTLHGTQPKSTA